jgi:maleylpyruvate isomerase
MLYGCDLAPYPTVRKIFETCMQIDAFTLAHPLQQADASKLG